MTPTPRTPCWTVNSRLYGVRKLWHAARLAGHELGRDQVARLMRIAGIDGVVRGKCSTTTTERDEHPAAARHPDLIQPGVAITGSSGSVVGLPILRMCGRCKGFATPDAGCPIYGDRVHRGSA